MQNYFNDVSLRISAAAVTLLSTQTAWAQTTGGDGGDSGGIFGPIPEIGGNADIRLTVLNILKTVLTFMALVAVVFIVIAGIRLVVSQGEEAEKDKAKKTILFVIVGLIVIILAQAIVDFVANQIATAAS